MVAFARSERLVCIVPRLMLGIDGRWEDTAVELPAGQFASVLTGGTSLRGKVLLGQLWADFPVALLEETSPT